MYIMTAVTSSEKNTVVLCCIVCLECCLYRKKFQITYSEATTTTEFRYALLFLASRSKSCRYACDEAPFVCYYFSNKLCVLSESQGGG